MMLQRYIQNRNWWNFSIYKHDSYQIVPVAYCHFQLKNLGFASVCWTAFYLNNDLLYRALTLSSACNFTCGNYFRSKTWHYENCNSIFRYPIQPISNPNLKIFAVSDLKIVSFWYTIGKLWFYWRTSDGLFMTFSEIKKVIFILEYATDKFLFEDGICLKVIEKKVFCETIPIFPAWMHERFFKQLKISLHCSMMYVPLRINSVASPWYNLFIQANALWRFVH